MDVFSLTIRVVFIDVVLVESADLRRGSGPCPRRIGQWERAGFSVSALSRAFLLRNLPPLPSLWPPRVFPAHGRAGEHGGGSGPDAERARDRGAGDAEVWPT